MRVKHKIKVNVAEDTDMKLKLFDRDDTLSEVIIDGYTQQSSGTLDVAAGVTEDISFGDVTLVKGFYLRVNQDIKLKFNGGSEEFQVRKSSSTSGVTAKFFAEMDFTQIEVIGHATEATSGVFCVWGAAS